MPTPAPPGGSAQPWVLAVLRGLGTTDNGDNALALALWAQAEGAPDWRHNWLNTTMPGYGGHSINSVGVRAYPTFTDGVHATVATLKQGIMSGVAYALRSGLDIQIIYKAINDSPWCHGCQNGHYPVTIYDYLKGLGQFPGGTVTAGTRPPAVSTDPPHWDWSREVRQAADSVHRRRHRLHGILQVLRHL